jgi:hypothetical protein
MGLDIKLPIGLMFVIFGIMLTIFGLATGSDSEMYARSLGVNINLWSGIGMLIFGSIMLFFAKGFKKKDTSTEK